MNSLRSTTVTSSTHPFDLSLFRPASLFVLLLLIWVALPLMSQARGLGPDNTATGAGALTNNTTGGNNTADGYRALGSNTGGNSNVGVGAYALGNNTTGDDNIAIGESALFSNTTANANLAIGSGALTNILSGNGNTAIGHNAGDSLRSGNFNIDIGFSVDGATNESNTIRIGSVQNATFIAGISGATVPSGVAVVVGTDGHLGTIVSSREFKDDIKAMDKSSEAILQLNPVTFRYKRNLDPDGIPQFGLVAEDVEKVNPDLVARNSNGKPYAVRYEAVNAMLLNEFLKAHHKMEDQQKRIEALEAQLKQQKTLIEKVSAEMELWKSPTNAIADNK